MYIAVLHLRGADDGTQGFVHVKQPLYYLMPNPQLPIFINNVPLEHVHWPVRYLWLLSLLTGRGRYSARGYTIYTDT